MPSCIDLIWLRLEAFSVPVTQGVTCFGPASFKALSGEPVMIMAAAAIALDTDKPEGGLVADVRLKEIWNLVASIRSGQMGSSFIVDIENRVVAHGNPSVVLRGTRFDPPGVQGVQRGLSGQESVPVCQDLSFGEQNFHIYGEGPVSEALALAIDTVGIMLAIVVIALLAAGGLVFGMVRRIVDPIEDIAETARVVSAGDLSRWAAVKSHGELSLLASAFNKMTFQLETLINDMEVLMEALKRILLVEDDPKDIELTLAALAEHNLANEVAVVRDGVEALDYLYRRESFAQRPTGNPVVILLDLKMPRMDGVQVLEQLKADEQLGLIPVVVLTSSRESLDLQACYRLGVNAYVVKPVRFMEFVDAVKQTGVFWALINQPPPEPMPEEGS
ncbi:MAG: response regulator [Desulfosarcinaceae bacterium]